MGSQDAPGEPVRNGVPGPTINQLLVRFLEHRCRGRKPVTIDRYLRIDVHLRLYLESRGPDRLCPDDAHLLAAERQFQPFGAFCRIMYADALLAALPDFLGIDWLMPQRLDCTVQISQSSRLVHWLVRGRVVDFRRQQHDLVRFRAALDALPRSRPC
ncbi:hypothetical protein LVY72_06290 [Arthrobacter sp. I2-34]|uniref:Uncharacterized protein n=1 Tax=Arthrobacter hankyongi TaxID=2904801 RepID=A0ABS9L4L6_9MICC|nr:hypothetical protein [Arthrobacter hankyongi]MCG2621523.1 hypothetical protein [Arthrobacter hankyongi]